MNILHVLSQLEVTGAEIYAISLMEEQKKRGHYTYIVSDTFSKQDVFDYFQLNVGRRDYPNRVKVIKELNKIVHERKIDVIHAHSRASSWVCHFVTLGTKIPLISTIHGRQHVHFSSKLFNIYGDQIVAICEDIKNHLSNNLKIKSRVALIRNGFNVEEGSKITNIPATEKQELLISYIGRLTGPKGEFVNWLINTVIPILYEKYPSLSFQIIGGQIVPGEIPESIKTFNFQTGKEVIKMIPYQLNLKEYMQKLDLIIGSGRVAIECMLFNKALIAVGEAKYIGLMSEDKIDQALETNFGDCGDFESYDKMAIVNDVERYISNREKYFKNSLWSKELIKMNFNIKSIATQVEDIYLENIAKLKSSFSDIKVLMYHKVVKEVYREPHHQTYVTEENFEKQIKFLIDLGYTPITFKDCWENYKTGKKFPDKPVIITFDDGYKDNYDVAFPVAKKFGIRFVIFAVGSELRNNFWDKEDQNFSSGLLNSDEIREMNNYGIEFGAHSISHSQLIDLSKNEIINEVKKSKEYLENILDSEVISFAYPYGKLNEMIKDIVRNSGFKFACATNSGPRSFFQDRFEIRRVCVFPSTTNFDFWKKNLKYYFMYKDFKNRFQNA